MLFSPFFCCLLGECFCTFFLFYRRAALPLPLLLLYVVHIYCEIYLPIFMFLFLFSTTYIYIYIHTSILYSLFVFFLSVYIFFSASLQLLSVLSLFSYFLCTSAWVRGCVRAVRCELAQIVNTENEKMQFGGRGRGRGKRGRGNE